MTDSDPSRKAAAQGSAARLETEVVRRARGWKDAHIADALIAQAATAAVAAAPPGEGVCEVTIVLTDDAEVRALNRTWRGKDAATNVLSFPASAQPAEPRPLGDVVLALETVQREAEEAGLALADHVCHLVVHGVLHLLGFDHTNDEEAALMEATESRVLASLGIADPYAAEAGAKVAEVAP